MENNLINYGVRNLTSRLAISKNIFFTWSSPLFLLNTQEMV